MNITQFLLFVVTMATSTFALNPYFSSLHGGNWGVSGRLHIPIHTGDNHQVTFDTQPTYTTHNHRLQNDFVGMNIGIDF